MEKATFEGVKQALLREVNRFLWQHYRQTLDELLNDLYVRRFTVLRNTATDDILKIVRISGVFATIHDPTVKDLQEAIDRFERGTFGLCLRCGREIPLALLERQPTVRFCVVCQQNEQKASSSPQSPEQGLYPYPL